MDRSAQITKIDEFIFILMTWFWKRSEKLYLTLEIDQNYEYNDKS